MVFTTGQHGTGYYADAPQDALPVDAGTVSRPVTLELSSLIAVSDGITDGEYSCSHYPSAAAETEAPLLVPREGRLLYVPGRGTRR